VLVEEERDPESEAGMANSEERIEEKEVEEEEEFEEEARVTSSPSSFLWRTED
jgi:hypothetical protein